jgi:hypothetical protein
MSFLPERCEHGAISDECLTCMRSCIEVLEAQLAERCSADSEPADLEQRVVDAITEWVGETPPEHAVAAAREAIAIVRNEPQAASALRDDLQAKINDLHELQDRCETVPLTMALDIADLAQSILDPAPHHARISPQQAWTCMGRRQALPEPAECNWPDCGCDPHATKVIESLIEQGWSAPQSQAGSVADSVKDMWLVGGPPDLKAMSGDAEDERVIRLHFRRKATEADRAWLLEAINAALTRQQPQAESSVPDIDAAYEKHAKKIYGTNPRPIDSITHFYAGFRAALSRQESDR